MGDAITKKLDKPIIFPQNKLGHFYRAIYLRAGKSYTSRVEWGLLLCGIGRLKKLDRLQSASAARGYTRVMSGRRRLSGSSGWNYSRYMNYENGERAIPPKQAILFASAFSVTVDYIYFGKGDILNQIERTLPLNVSKIVRRIPLVGVENICGTSTHCFRA